MKKCILFILCLIGTIAYGQNTFKYEVRANGGLRVGGSTFAEIDSITLQAGKLRIMTGATLQKIAGHVLYTDTALMLAPYALTSELGEAGIGIADVRDEIADSLNIAIRPSLTTAYDDRLKWDGGSAGLNAATARTSLGGTSIGQSLFTLPNYNQTRYLQISYNNTISTFTSTDYLIELGASLIGRQVFRMGTVADGVIALNSDSPSAMSWTNASTKLKQVGDLFTNPVFSGSIPPRQSLTYGSSVTDTLATQAYARQYGGSGTIVMEDVQDEIADSLNVLRTNIVVGDGTKGPFFDGSADGGQTLTFYGDNGFWTALQGGAPVANRSYRLPIAELPGAGTTSLMNIDQYGNMGFAFNGIPATLTATELGYSDGVTSSIQNQLNAKVNASDTAAMLAPYALLSEIGTGGDISTLKTRVDSIVDVLKDSVNVETLLQIDFDTDTLAKLSDVRSLAGSGVVGVTLNGGTLTLTGDLATADDITFYTNGDGQYDLPAGGGNLTIQSQVQGWISDTADVLRAEMGSAPTSSIYYVSNSGSDAADGLTPATAWQTISKVNGSSFLPGDKILFKSGDTWRETLNIPSSGTVSDYITFGSYGTGNKPKILGSTEVTTWTQSHGNVWYSFNAAYIDPYSFTYDANIYFKETNGNINWGRIKKATWGDLTVEYDWAWTLDTLYIYSPTNPNTRYSGIEMSQRENSININSKEYITIDEIEVGYGASNGIYEQWTNPATNMSGIIIKNCHIHHIGIKESLEAYGIVMWHSDALIQNNIIHDCGRRGISLNIGTNGATVSNILIEGNTLYNGFHTTGIDIATQGTSSYDNVVIRNNLIYNNATEVIDGAEVRASHFVYVSEEGTGTLSNVYLYNNIFKNAKGSVLLLNVTSCFVYNNIFYGINTSLATEYIGFLMLTGDTNGEVRNNIFYNNTVATTNANYASLHVNTTGTVTSDYNLFYNTDNGTRMTSRAGSGWGAWTMPDWATYLSQTSQDAHSPTPADPLFISSSNYQLQSGSPAINTGTALNIPTDYLGNLRISSYDIGAYEKQDDVLDNFVRLDNIVPIFVFGAGGGMPTDTATFQNGVIAGAFYNSGSDNLKITSLRGVLAEGTGTETIGVQVSWHATFKSASAVNLNSSAYTITSITTGNEDTSFANDEIPPGVWVWCTLSGASANNKPTLLSLTMSGYKIPIY